MLSHTLGLIQQQGVVIAHLKGVPIGYSRFGWYSSRPETRFYFQISFMIPEKRAYRTVLIAENERRLRQFAPGHAPVPDRFSQAWAAQNQMDCHAVLESSSYKVVQCFSHMRYSLGEAPL